MYDTCYKTDTYGVYLWTAGRRFKDNGREFVWQLYTAKTQYGPTSIGHYYYSPMHYTYWHMYEPNNANVNEHCVNIWPNLHFRWNDNTCGSEHCFICEDRNL